MKILMIDDTFFNVFLLRLSFPKITFAWQKHIDHGYDKDRDYYDLVLVDVFGTGYTKEVMKDFDSSKTWIHSTTQLKDIPKGFKFVIKSDLGKEIKTL